MQNSWLVLLPPLLVILCSYLTQNIIISLLAGIMSALFIAHDFSLIKIIPSFMSKIWSTTEIGTITSWQTFWSAQAPFICLFLLILASLTVMLQRSGGAQAYGNFVKKYFKKKWQVEAATLSLSSLLFIDDYFSNLTVGSVMQSVTDQLKIPRLKLAILANSMAAPLTVLLPISSWVAEIMMQMQRSGVTKTITQASIVIGDPFSIYLSIIPFFFYSWIITIVTWILVLSKTSFGVIKKHETIATQTENLFGGQPEITTGQTQVVEKKNSSFIDFMLPMGILFVAIFGSMISLGAFYGLSIRDVPKAGPLAIGACIAFIFGSFFLISRNKISPQEIGKSITGGIELMGSSVVFLLLMWTLSSLLSNELATGNYIASFIDNGMNISLLPCIFFIITAITGTIMGTAWGAIALFIPIGLRIMLSLLSIETPIPAEQLTIFPLLLGAIVSGSLVSNHLSPISDNILMATKSSGAYHHDVVKAQFQMSMPVIISSTLSFLCAGFFIFWMPPLSTALFSLVIGIACNLCIIKIASS